MAGDQLLDERKVSQRPEGVGPARGPQDPRAQAEGVLREVAYVLHLTRRVTAALTRTGAGAARPGGEDAPGA